MRLRTGCVIVGFLLFVLSLAAQTAGSSSTSSQVPPLMNFKGVLADANGKPLTGTVGMTFYLYQEQQGGAPLWLETQNVQADKTGHYSVALGSASSQGLPASVFASGEARWLGVQVQGQAEQPRVLLMSVPYALKALDAETIGGKPASAFMMAPASNSKSQSPNLPPGTITGSGTADFVPVFTGATTIGNSKIFQTVGGDVGIGTTTPAAVLDVKGAGDIRDTLTLFPKLTHPSLSVHGTAFEVSGKGLVTFISGQTFPGTGTVTRVGSGAGLTGGPITSSGTLSIANGGVTNAMLGNSSLTVTANGPLSGGGSVSLGGSTSLGLKACAANQILQFVSGAWTCANPATGTVTSVGSGLGLSGGPITGSGTLTINTSVVPQLAAANTFTANQTVTGEIVAGTGSGSSAGVLGEANAASGQTYCVGGFAVSPAGYGVEGLNLAGSGGGIGVYGSGSTGVVGVSASGGGPGGNFAGYTAPLNSGLYGTDGIDSTGGIGDINGADTGGVGVAGQGGYGGDFDAVGGRFTGGNFYCCGDGVLGNAGSGYAGNFNGDLNVTGQIFAGVKDFKIDHPLDPANKYLVHASVESSEMKNIYTGNVTTDAQGHATVQLPEWFEVLNTDFRYQLTVIGQFAQAIIGRKIENNRFEIRTSAPNVEVSWQVTGVRQDAFAKAHPLAVEQEKGARLRGFYIHPELYGAPPEKQIEWARHPQMMKHQQAKVRPSALTVSGRP